VVYTVILKKNGSHGKINTVNGTLNSYAVFTGCAAIIFLNDKIKNTK